VLHIFCDESGADGKTRYLVHGALFVRHPALPSLVSRLRAVVAGADVRDEVKWSSTSRLTLPRNLLMIDAFCEIHTDGEAASSPRFQALVVDQHQVDTRGYHHGDKDMCFYKFLYQLLLQRITEMGKDDEPVHITLDYRTTKAYDLGELRTVLNNGIRQKRSSRPPKVLTVVYKDSRESECLQLADYLTGALCFQRNGRHVKAGASDSKCTAAAYLAKKVGLRNLTCQNRRHDKFGIWTHRLGPIKKAHRAA
jgi:hypothetical protein